jgi:hypothetical protein
MRVWILGNGPSLKETPLHLLKDEVTIGVNRINLIFPHTTWRPTYFVMTDAWYNPQYYDKDIHSDRFVREITEVMECGAYAFLGPFIWESIALLKNGGFGGRIQGVCPICSEIVWDSTSKHCPKEWHTRKEYCSFGGSMSAALQIVNRERQFVECDTIYLLGCDLNYSDTEPSHFDDDYMDFIIEPKPASVEQANKIRAHEIAKRCSRIPIFNATIGGELEVYPRVDMREILCQ